MLALKKYCTLSAKKLICLFSVSELFYIFAVLIMCRLSFGVVS